LKAAGVEKGSGKNASTKVGKITRAQALEIAKKKMVDLNSKDDEGAINIIAGSARSMGIEVK
jgi:large subunit ribosomal protein L11